MPDRVYITRDLKSFYASVECIERGLEPLTTKSLPWARKKLEPLEGRLTLADGTTIPIEGILEVEGELFAELPFEEELS